MTKVTKIFEILLVSGYASRHYSARGCHFTPFRVMGSEILFFKKIVFLIMTANWYCELKTLARNSPPLTPSTVTRLPLIVHRKSSTVSRLPLIVHHPNHSEHPPRLSFFFTIRKISFVMLIGRIRRNFDVFMRYPKIKQLFFISFF